MLKVYTYSAADVAHIGFADPETYGDSDNSFRLDHVEATTDPETADLILVPLTLRHFVDVEQMRKLPLFERYEAKHVFFDCSDYAYTYGGVSSTLIRCNLRQWMLDIDPNSISWHWPVEDYAECVAPPDGGFLFDVGFHGWMSSETRTVSTMGCLISTLSTDIVQYDNFTGHIWETPEGLRRRAAFRQNLRECRVQLCPESIPGVFPYRFFEAMSAGRVPLLFSSGYVLPHEKKVWWDDVTLRYPASEASRAAEIIGDFVRDNSDDEIIDMGHRARDAWQTYLNCHNNTTMWTEALEERFGA